MHAVLHMTRDLLLGQPSAPSRRRRRTQGFSMHGCTCFVCFCASACAYVAASAHMPTCTHGEQQYASNSLICTLLLVMWACCHVCCYLRTVLTQSPTTYKLKLETARFTPLAEREHGAWAVLLSAQIPALLDPFPAILIIVIIIIIVP